MSGTVPPGYVELARPGSRILAQEACADALLHASAHGTLYEWAATQTDKRELRGRLPVYALTLPFEGPAVVIRRNHHGGWLAWRKDRFVFPRGAFELYASLALTHAGIPTPDVIACATYRINRFESRIDIVTRELPAGMDLGAALLDETAGEPQRSHRWHAVRELLATLASRGVWHRDLNVKNIYLIDRPEQTDRPVLAVLLDVDRVKFAEPGAIVADANSSRLRRSLRKWRATRGAKITDADFALVAKAAVGA